jgi:hypothetical protein
LATGNALNLGTLTLPNVENVTIDVQANGNANLTLSDTALTSLTLKATHNLTFNAQLNSAKLTTVDATGVNGKLTIDTQNSNESVTISLGNGDNVVTVGDGNGADDITTVNLGTGANTIKVSYDDAGSAPANGFFIATGFNAGVGGDLVDFKTAVTYEQVDSATAAQGASTVIVVTPNPANNMMNVTGSDENTLRNNFVTYANANAFDNVGVGNLVGDLYIVQGNDNNAYIFRVDNDAGTTGQIDAADINNIQLIGVLVGVKTADLVAGNFS